MPLDARECPNRHPGLWQNPQGVIRRQKAESASAAIRTVPSSEASGIRVIGSPFWPRIAVRRLSSFIPYR